MTHLKATPVTRLTHTVRETADMLGISTRTVHSLIHQGRLNAVSLPGKFLVRADSLQRLLDGGAAARDPRPEDPGAGTY
jgi:excisionase family DNA binding protein